MRHGIPIMLGYFSVSFGFGVLCIQKNLSMLAAVGISVTNLTSASLMSLSLSQKLDPSFNLMHRLFAGYGVTDEIFAVASAQTEPLTPAYMYGLILTPFLGWSSGTLLGALAGDIMPASVTAALSLMLYGMFMAIIVPPAKKNSRVLFAVLIAAALSVVMHYCLPMISGGFAIIIAAVIASVTGALFFPVTDENKGEEKK